MEMNTGDLLKNQPSKKHSEGGVALVLVLAFLVLISVLVVAFYSTVTTELSSAKGYASGVNARQLADSATQAVIGQIRDATTKGRTVAWASQPGMIRTYDSAGEPVNYFKLYSSENMVLAKSQIASFTPETDLDASWNTKPGLYTDLNAPVLVSDTSNSSVTYPVFPIIDPKAAGVGSNSPVEGFSYTKKIGVGDVAGVVVANNSTDNTARLPMPVKWIYVLRDGTWTAPTDYDTAKQLATWVGASADKKPSAANPIVGRVAFWADDETCKINLNTASEPTPWDTPRCISKLDLDYGKNQPAHSEFQRFPGHPYSVALSPVFFPNTVLTTSQKQSIYEAMPRVAWGGSEAATKPVWAIGKVTLDSDRLFGSVDEFLFKPDRTLNSLVDPAALKRSRFFLTTSSRAPEVNLFGQPRVSLWPVHSNPSRQFRSAYDDLSAFCSTLTGSVGATGQNYYFQRSNASSDIADWNLLDANGSPRNQILYAYLQRLTDQDIPGFGGKFSSASKWGIDRDEILTEIFDYIRSVNLQDPQVGSRFSNRGQITPIKIPTTGGETRGFGRIHSVSQVGFHFICNSASATERVVAASFLFEPFTVSHGYYPLIEQISYEVTFKNLIKLDGKNLGFPANTVNLASGGSFSSTWHGRNWGPSGGLRGPIMTFGGGNYPLVSSTPVAVSVAGGKKTMEFTAGAIQVKVFSEPGKILTQTFDFNFPGGTFPIPDLVNEGTTGYRGADGTDANYWRQFSSRYSATGQAPQQPGPEYGDTNRQFGNGAESGFKKGGIFRKEDVVRTIVPKHGDMRLVAAKSEPLKDVEFVKVAGWADPQEHFYHIFTDPVGTHAFYGFANEPPVPGYTYSRSKTGDQLTPADYHWSRLPEINPGAGKEFNKWNDFDNGVAHLYDGAFINKPDEGCTTQSGSHGYFAWNFSEPRDVQFSPNRFMKSAGMLGSLPTGVRRNQPWQTLLFRPQLNHPGNGVPVAGPPFTVPPDHLIMDLFWMSVVEPYAISEPFSTAGKINMNYQIAPFSYIRRATALHAVLKGEEPLAIVNSMSRSYKLWDHETSDHPWLPNDPYPLACQDPYVRQHWDDASKGNGTDAQNMRKAIDPIQTLQQFDDYFKSKGIFRTATQICEMHLVRLGESLSEYKNGTIWPKSLVTGDNTRENPYACIYAKLTTKSNSYTVHMRVQGLKKRVATTPGDDEVWKEGGDQIVSEFRGATLIERYIDTGSPMPDFANSSTTATVDDFYKFRIISTKRFVP